jgi:signal transduction histidine kinase
MAIYEDSYSELWFGTDNGLCRLIYDDNNLEHFTSFEHDPADSTSLSSNYIRKIYEDTHGVLWIATGMGLNKYDRLKEKFVRNIHDPGNNNSLINDNVITLHEDKYSERNIIWIATENGLDKFNTVQNSFKHYNEQDGLPNNAILGILQDKSRNLWISTIYGFTKFDPDKKSFTYFDLSDGLQSYEFNYNAYLQARNGEMYFGGVNGFNVFHPDSVRDEDYLPPIVITDFQIFNKPVSIGTNGKPIDQGEKKGELFLHKSITAINKIILTYKQNVFSFGYAALDYTAPENNKYVYMMEGFDKNWINAGTRRLATYTNLDPGDYVFKVKGTNNDGVWNEEEAAVILIITPPPWKTWWAYTIYVLILIAALVGFRRYELNKRKRKEEEQLRREREAAKLREAKLQAKTIQAEKEIEKQQIRTRIATDLHDEIGSNLSSISLISGMIQNQPGLSKEIKEALLDVNRAASQSTESIRDIVWFINPMSDQLSDLLSKLKETANSMLTNIEFNFVSSENESVKKINPEIKRNVYLIFKEILNNIIKHSQASQVDICIKEDGNKFSVSIEDNGVGFEESTVKKGNGLLNLRRRAEQIIGKLDILTSLGNGTKITLQFIIT